MDVHLSARILDITTLPEVLAQCGGKRVSIIMLPGPAPGEGLGTSKPDVDKRWMLRLWEAAGPTLPRNAREAPD